jgi:mono/diheme cytochrome c family protein
MMCRTSTRVPRLVAVVFALAFALATALAGGAQAQTKTVDATPPAGDETTGRMLYVAHCHGCHQTQIHWRDHKIAHDWPGLVREVRRWQRNAGIAWSDEEILAVGHYLNATFYRFPVVDAKELAVHRP